MRSPRKWQGAKKGGFVASERVRPQSHVQTLVTLYRGTLQVSSHTRLGEAGEEEEEFAPKLNSLSSTFQKLL